MLGVILHEVSLLGVPMQQRAQQLHQVLQARMSAPVLMEALAHGASQPYELHLQHLLGTARAP
ncbi:hypothetical protein HC928_22585 [bacterium]|nr:hypothetical protein [bacterium]